jgi:hypothetical protein
MKPFHRDAADRADEHPPDPRSTAVPESRVQSVPRIAVRTTASVRSCPIPRGHLRIWSVLLKNQRRDLLTVAPPERERHAGLSLCAWVHTNILPHSVRHPFNPRSDENPNPSVPLVALVRPLDARVDWRVNGIRPG